MRRWPYFLALVGLAAIGFGAWLSGNGGHFAMIGLSGSPPTDAELWIGGGLATAGGVAFLIGVGVAARGGGR
jgi:hypothetical protein